MMKRSAIHLRILSIFFFLLSSPIGQDSAVLYAMQSALTGQIKGSVKSSSGEELICANIVICQFRQGCIANDKGEFNFKNVKPGTYTLEISLVGYEKLTKQIVVRGGEVSQVDVVLKQTAFQIGEMQVTANSELMQSNPETKTTISSGEIEHFQASNIGDILDLVPGIQKSSNPGLGKTIQIGVRGDEANSMTAFGTKIMVDGIPVSNNANMQFEKWSNAVSGTSNVGRGVDMRTIPADNIEAVEVYRGIPSVKYGELTSGLVDVKTRVGLQPHRLKIKTNPDTREANMGGGMLLGDINWSYNANAAQSERDIRKTGDEYSRLTGQIVATKKLMDNQLTLNSKVFGQRIFDEEEPKEDMMQTRNYNRGYSLTYGLWGDLKPDNLSSFNFNSYVTYRRENSMKSKLVQSDIRILPNGDTISTYVGKVETRGNEWTVGGRFEWQRTFNPGETFHTVLIGSEVQYDANTGDGLVVDSNYNYYGASSPRRSYSFNDIPGQLIGSIYAEDKISGNLWIDYTLTAGFRYEMYRPFGIDFKGLFGGGDFVRSRHGSYLNPRGSLMLVFSPSSQLRLSAGVLSKSPPMSQIYSPTDYIKWRNPVLNRTEYIILDRQAPWLQAYREQQFEASYDQKLFDLVGTSISAFYKTRIDEITSRVFPIFVLTSSGSRNYLYYIQTESRLDNAGESITKGIELSVKTKKIVPLNVELQVTGSYLFSKSNSDLTSFDGSPDLSLGRYPNNRVMIGPIDTMAGYWYPSSQSWSDNILMNYSVRYTNQDLGIWVSLRAEHLLWRNKQYTRLEPIDQSLSSVTASVLAQRAFDESVKKEPPKWLININISKSLYAGAEVSFYVNNVIDDAAIWQYQISPDPTNLVQSVRNPELFYGIEFSTSIDGLWK